MQGAGIEQYLRFVIFIRLCYTMGGRCSLVNFEYDSGHPYKCYPKTDWTLTTYRPSLPSEAPDRYISFPNHQRKLGGYQM